MKGEIDSINHVGLVVHDLDATCNFYEDLGFILSPLSMHKGALKPGEPEQPYGTGNRCAVFPKNYFEIFAHVNKDIFDFNIKRFLGRFEGAHIIAFNCGDASVVAKRLDETGIENSGVIPLERDVDTPEGLRAAKFDCIHFSASLTPEGLIQAAHHRTPQYIHQPQLLEHPNKAVALSETILCTDDPEATEHRYRSFLGFESVREGAKRVFRFPLVSRLSIVSPDEIADVVPGCVPPVLPYMAETTFATTDIDAVRRRLDKKGITDQSFGGKITVPAEVAFGHAIAFEPA